LARALDFELAESNLYCPSHLGWYQPVFGKKRRCRISLRLSVENLDLFDPRRSLGIVDLAQVKHLALDNPAAGAALVLGQAPIAMLLAIFEAFMALEEQRRLAHLAPQCTRPHTRQKEGRSVTEAFGDPKTTLFLGFSQTTPPKLLKTGSGSESQAKANLPGGRLMGLPVEIQSGIDLGIDQDALGHPLLEPLVEAGKGHFMDLDLLMSISAADGDPAETAGLEEGDDFGGQTGGGRA
jgi:hypothetical protein